MTVAPHIEVGTLETRTQERGSATRSASHPFTSSLHPNNLVPCSFEAWGAGMAQEYETVREAGLAIIDIRKDLKLYAAAFGFIALLGVGAIGFLAEKAFDAQRSLGGIEGRLDGIDNTLIRIDARVAGVEARLTGLEDRMIRIEAIAERIDANTRRASLEVEPRYSATRALREYPVESESDLDQAINDIQRDRELPALIFDPDQLPTGFQR